ncbi:hypothetical protein GIB67_029668 [Kingdonia uniflora]|uniref:Uncharacterized protein n=1 Tax=Kingdonia uniflora TaxID=39325 RepID=A0A7J7LLQ3_9MAGN|nr:hypothetical protein GIB67_029668 [Kingdonia uniflora]
MVAMNVLTKICDNPFLLTKEEGRRILNTMGDIYVIVAEIFSMNIVEESEVQDAERMFEDLSCKISFILLLSESLILKGHNILILSHRVKMLSFVQNALLFRGYNVLWIENSTNIYEEVQIMLMKTSHNRGICHALSKVDHVIVVDGAWDRRTTEVPDFNYPIHMRGKKDTFVNRLISSSTIEQHMYNMQVYKGVKDGFTETYKVWYAHSEKEIHEDIEHVELFEQHQNEIFMDDSGNNIEKSLDGSLSTPPDLLNAVDYNENDDEGGPVGSSQEFIIEGIEYEQARMWVLKSQPCYDTWKREHDNFIKLFYFMDHTTHSLDFDSAVTDTAELELTFDLRRVANFSILWRINDAWKRHKFRLNKKYIKGKDPAKVKATPPPFVPKEVWVEFVDMCNSDAFQAQSKKNTENCSKVKVPCTAGRTSMAVVHHNLAVERNVPDEDVGRANVFIKAHTKADKTYQCPKIIEKLQENMNLYPDSNKIGHDDVLAKTLGKDKKGHMMAMGIDITPSFVANAIHIVEENEDLKATNNELKTMLLNMRKDLDDHIKKISGAPQIQPSSSYNAPSNSSQATQIQDIEESISYSDRGSTYSLFALDTQEKQSQCSRTIMNYCSTDVTDNESGDVMRNIPGHISDDLTMNNINVDAKSGVDMKECVQHQDDHNIESGCRENSKLDMNGKHFEGKAVHFSGKTSSVMHVPDLRSLNGDSEKQQMPVVTCNNMAPQVPQVVGDSTSGTSAKTSRSSVSNNDDFDEKGKLSVVQQRGRFKVTSENIALEKGIPFPMLQKSHSLQVSSILYVFSVSDLEFLNLRRKY